MIAAMIALFVLGYLCIATEHILHINKATFALILCALLWAILGVCGFDRELLHGDMLKALGETSEIVFFLIGAMTIVELIDRYGGFSIIIKRIHARNKRQLMWILAIVTFILSAILDNMTTTIIMVMMMRRMLTVQRERWLFAAVIVMAANSGGAWSPIGDVTTIMLWMRNLVNSTSLVYMLIIPAIVSTIIPTWIATRFIKADPVEKLNEQDQRVGYVMSEHHPRISRGMLIGGVAGLIFVPIFKSITHLPPYMGILISLGFLWLATEVIVRRYDLDKKIEGRISQVMTRIDMSSVLFFLGILMAVSALGAAGILDNMAVWLNETFSNIFIINTFIGALSSIIDNVPLVAACMDMYAGAAGVDFAPDGLFWHLQAYCAGVGGSMLIIGSAAGVVAMAIEKISFTWYLKNFSWMAMLGYLAGVGVIALFELFL